MHHNADYTRLYNGQPSSLNLHNTYMRINQVALIVTTITKPVDVIRKPAGHAGKTRPRQRPQAKNAPQEKLPPRVPPNKGQPTCGNCGRQQHGKSENCPARGSRCRPVARLFCGGGQIGQIWGPFMITRGLSCDRVEFGHFGGGSDDPPDPPGYGPALFQLPKTWTLE